ncbi:hypothetical protein [Thalassomonas actiniarum]|uniref:Uncharacterized protein n=1 Tax=Thalassomonas actiniarum TaxID=485447 RepID=A0AAF0C5F5_9GAMM|nr:hypothetical protein [Thalassomonas actiniarum]WDE00810.1 hypothetical protein SG35_009350 [Thalassomonas actiniarum]
MPSVNQATKVFGENIYRFGGESIEILDAPADTDWQRWGMLNDRKLSRMYFFKKGSDDKVYQFLHLGGVYRYDASIPELTITYIVDDIKNGTKEDIRNQVDTSTISMLSTPNFEEVNGVNGKALPVPNNYHIYMQGVDNQQEIHQFIWERGTDRLEANGITRAKFAIIDFPQDTDWGRWAITYDSNQYQLALEAYVYYAFKQGSNSEIYHGRYGHKDDQGNDVYGYEGILTLEGAPENTDPSSMSVMFDGVDTHLYMLTK